MAKAKLDRTIGLLQEALRSFAPDFATSRLRSLLHAAVAEACHVAKKRQRRERNAMEEAVAKAQQINDQWWKAIEENVRKAVDKDANKDSEKETEENT